jgi:penicillin-binding protein 2
VDIYEENPGLLPTTEWMDKRYGVNGWTRGFLPSLGIGQGELGVTPLQMAAYAMVLGNKGHYHQPHAVRSVIRKGTQDTLNIGYKEREIRLAEGTWRVIREGMRGVVEEPGGTGGLARVKGIQSGGKTGTAQNPHGKSHSWYIGFAPFDTPRIAIVAMIENVGYGGSYAAPIAGMCIEHYLYGRLVRFDRPPRTGQAIVQASEAEQAPDMPLSSAEEGRR